ncbi:inhibitor of growth proteins N-terminal histone-binding-domain-containing protein [Fimicolochytrium jonesii]|uniref:inhibitor of growth proteins N-terminal histone-binding-domain-containing protein n=1 Tax=Fimicolochytrium jonesii TaxID=1396493 RepID=UPI0022FE53DA|nr:inhibitor of growth proteins N-terminal histone-binding-domain-containing protein [Fimicolochytrium jonesii]KAI8818478.1 inhibitor of growth proteins N-terminal histone-binding-domain-containing protein [Fimicolochytrium jonesii]
MTPAPAMALLYLEDYLDTIESLPIELGRNFSLMRELDSRAHDATTRISTDTKKFMDDLKDLNPEEVENRLKEISRCLKETLRHGEEKVALAVQTYEMVDKHCRRLDDDLSKFEEEQMTGPKAYGSMNVDVSSHSRGSTAFQKGDKRGLPGAGGETPKKKQKRGTPRLEDRSTPKPGNDTRASSVADRDLVSQNNKKSSAATQGKNTKKIVSTTTHPTLDKRPTATTTTTTATTGAGLKDKIVMDLPIDPNEPTYCICGRVSFGDMIGCDNSDCDLEWFHYECVGLTAPPKGSWFCPACAATHKKR